MKNSFKQLRAEKNAYKNKYEASCKIIDLQTKEIDKLNDSLNEKESCIKWLNHNLKSEKKINKSIIKSAQSHKLHKDFFYDNWIKEIENKIRITKKLTISLVVNAVLIATITILIIK